MLKALPAFPLKLQLPTARQGVEDSFGEREIDTLGGLAQLVSGLDDLEPLLPNAELAWIKALVWVEVQHIHAAEALERSRPPSMLESIEDALESGCTDLGLIVSVIQTAIEQNFQHPAFAALEQKRDQLLDNKDKSSRPVEDEVEDSFTAFTGDLDKFNALAGVSAVPAADETDVGEWLAGLDLGGCEGLMRENLVERLDDLLLLVHGEADLAKLGVEATAAGRLWGALEKVLVEAGELMTPEQPSEQPSEQPLEQPLEPSHQLCKPLCSKQKAATRAEAAAEAQKEASKSKAFKDPTFCLRSGPTFCYVPPAPVVFSKSSAAH